MKIGGLGQLFILLWVSLIQVLGIAYAQNEAPSVENFVNSIGIATRFNHSSYYAETPFIENVILPKIEELGIRNIIDSTGFEGLGLLTYSQRLKALSDRGIEMTLRLEPNIESGYLGTNNPNDNVEGLRPKLRTMIYGGFLDGPNTAPRAFGGGINITSIQGLNERDHVSSLDTTCNSYETDPILRINECSPGWSQHLLQFSEDLYTAIKGDPQLSHLSVQSPTLVNVSKYSSNSAPVGGGTLWDYLRGLNNFFDVGAGNFYCWKKGQYRCFDTSVSVQENFFGNPDMVAKETGYFTEGSDPNRASEIQQSKYNLRALVDFYKRGFKKTFLYELKDRTIEQSGGSEKESSFGILQEDGTPKVAFNSLKNLFLILNSTVPGNHLSVADPVITLTPLQSGDIHSLLLKKQPGVYYLLLHNEPTGASTDQDASIPTRIRIDNAATVSVYRPSIGSAAIDNFRPLGDFALTLPDDVTILKIEFPAPTPTPTTTPVLTSTPGTQVTITPEPTLTPEESPTPDSRRLLPDQPTPTPVPMSQKGTLKGTATCKKQSKLYRCLIKGSLGLISNQIVTVEGKKTKKQWKIKTYNGVYSKTILSKEKKFIAYSPYASNVSINIKTTLK